jgi:hypothetical protein
MRHLHTCSLDLLGLGSVECTWNIMRNAQCGVRMYNVAGDGRHRERGGGLATTSRQPYGSAQARGERRLRFYE